MTLNSTVALTLVSKGVLGCDIELNGGVDFGEQMGCIGDDFKVDEHNGGVDFGERKGVRV